jgi:hypothetical protein
MWTSAPLGDGLFRIWFELVSSMSTVLLLFELGFAKILMTVRENTPLGPNLFKKEGRGSKKIAKKSEIEGGSYRMKVRDTRGTVRV